MGFLFPSTLLQNLVTLVGGLVLAFVYGWKMTLVVIGALPLIGIAATIQTKSFISATGKVRHCITDCNGCSSLVCMDMGCHCGVHQSHAGYGFTCQCVG